jgi:hypothetical protein
MPYLGRNVTSGSIATRGVPDNRSLVLEVMARKSRAIRPGFSLLDYDFAFHT